ncbi:hypothetical protein DL89DRAFT_293705 [Linderina pennispora]|uniref:TPR-like protein n=1 Tax=Linderina pennispora TaxID=61395 RepID=A0A1Y1W814_9FUNG|nr:uncharacterized protein DL89DRAFT_293705 [Linderina pennispora]ORX69304.1 hypothetical protein DL89DRAFT_293705 [Linderina pennispora]
MALSTLERQLLLGQTVDRSADAQTDQSAEALAALLSQGQYEQVLRSEAAQYLFRTLAADEDVTASSLQATAQQQAQQFATQHGAAGWASLTWIGAAALQAFIQTNWTGPEFLMDPAELLLAVADKYKEELPEGASKHEIGRRDQLGTRVSGSGAEQGAGGAPTKRRNTLTPRPLFLALARWLLAVGSARWWASRVLLAQQSLLEYPAQSLLDQIMDGYSAPVPELGEDSPMSRSAATHTWDAVGRATASCGQGSAWEHGVAYAQHQMTRDAVQQLTAAQAASGLASSDTAQLVLLAQSAQPARKADQGAAPESFALNDDTLLEQIAFTDLDISGQQAAAGAGRECFAGAQMMPFVVRVLQHPGNWSIYTMALLQRSRLEAAKTRTVERATLQLQALVDQISHPLPEAHEAGPMRAPAWELERELAKQFMALGVVRSALDIFERLHMWDEVIACYQMLGQEEVAERIIREQLDLAPSRPKLWCLLGDLKQDPAHWRHAWDFDDSVACYKHALKLNPLFERSPATTTPRVDAFQQVVHIDYENSEAWNNLASIHMPQAWYALREALKGKYDSSAPPSTPWTRIVQLRAEKDGAACVDLDILRGIISSLTRGTLTRNDNEREARRKEQQYSKYIEHLLVNAIEAKITNSAPLWRVMADFWFWRRDYKHCLDCYIKAYRCYSQMPPGDAVDAALELADMYENLGDKVQVVKAPSAQDGQQQNDQEVAGDDQRKAAAIEQPVCSDWKHQTKMLLRGLIGKGKESFEGTPDYERLVEALKELRQA